MNNIVKVFLDIIPEPTTLDAVAEPTTKSGSFLLVVGSLVIVIGSLVLAAKLINNAIEKKEKREEEENDKGQNKWECYQFMIL